MTEIMSDRAIFESPALYAAYCRGLKDEKEYWNRIVPGLRDCELIVRLSVLEEERHWWMEYWVADDGSGWNLIRWAGHSGSEDNELIDSGPIVDGVPQLTEKARAAMREAIGK